MAAMLLADFGADVVKVEPPAGEPGRRLAGFPVWNRNKCGLVIELERADHLAHLHDLLRAADVCIFSRRTAQLRRLALDPGSTLVANPGIVYLHTPPFTADGEGSDLPESGELLSAECGVSYSQYAWEDVPVDPVIPHVVYGQAIWAAAAAVAALVERQRSGRGQAVTVGGLHGVLVTMSGLITQQPGVAGGHPPGGPGGPIPFYRLYECADGEWMFLAGLTPAFYTAALSTLGLLEELLADPRLNGELAAVALPENAEWSIPVIADAFKRRPRAEWLGLIREAGCPCGPVQDRDTWFDHPQIAALGMRTRVEDPERGPVDMPGISLNLLASPASVRAPAPVLGAPGVGAPPWRQREPVAAGDPRPGGPLAGYRVLDVGAIIAGTYAGSLLAELGADVIKVEPPSGDNLRAYGKTFVGYNLGKRSLALDLSRAEGRDCFYRMVREADMVVDNYRPGVLERLGVDYESLRRVNPRVISVSVTGYGESGPLGGEPGFDPLLQAASGMMRAQGGGEAPVFYTLPVNDVASAAMACLGGVLALYHRERMGVGQRVWTSLAGQSVMMQSGEIARFAGRPAARVGGRDYPGPGPLARLYRCADGWIRVQATTGAQTVALFRALDVHDAAQGDGDVARTLQAALARLPRDATVERLRAAGVPAAPARTIEELTTERRFLENDAVARVNMGDGAPLWVAGRFARFSRTEKTGRAAPPGLGEHTREVLAELGLSGDEIDRLERANVVRSGAGFRL